MEFEINLIAVLVAAAVNMVLGYTWFSKVLFGKQWMALSGISEGSMKKMDSVMMMKTLVAGIAIAFVMAYVLAHFLVLSGATTIQEAAQPAFWIWLGFVAPVQMGTVLWERKPFNLFLINSLYYLVGLLLSASIIILIS